MATKKAKKKELYILCDRPNCCADFFDSLEKMEHFIIENYLDDEFTSCMKYLVKCFEEESIFIFKVQGSNIKRLFPKVQPFKIIWND